MLRYSADYRTRSSAVDLPAFVSGPVVQWKNVRFTCERPKVRFLPGPQSPVRQGASLTSKKSEARILSGPPIFVFWYKKNYEVW